MITIDDLKKHLDDRLDNADTERRAQAEKIGDLQRTLAGMQATIVEQAKSADKEHENIKDTCKARHESTSKKIAVRDKYLGLGIVGVVGAAAKLVWDAVTKTREGG